MKNRRIPILFAAAAALLFAAVKREAAPMKAQVRNIYINTEVMETLWETPSCDYTVITCYHDGDTDMKSGALRFTGNGTSQDVSAGQSARFAGSKEENVRLRCGKSSVSEKEHPDEKQ